MSEENQTTMDVCPVCEHVGFRIYIGEEDREEWRICMNCGVFLHKEDLEGEMK